MSELQSTLCLVSQIKEWMKNQKKKHNWFYFFLKIEIFMNLYLYILHVRGEMQIEVKYYIFCYSDKFLTQESNVSTVF